MKDYNFFEIYGRKKGSINLRSPYFAGSLIVLICLIISGFLIGRNIFMGTEIKALQGEIEALQSNPAYSEALLIKQDIDALNEYDYTAESVLKQFEDSNIITTDLLARIAAQIPETTTLTEINIDNATAELTFRAPNRKAVAEILMRFKESGLFQDVTFDTITSMDGVNAVEVIIYGVMKAGEPG